METPQNKADTPLTRLLRERLQIVSNGIETELARQVGTSQQNINNYLTGKVLKPHYWRMVNQALGITDDEWRQAYNATRGVVAEPNATILTGVRPPMSTGKMIPVYGRAVGGAEGKYIFNGSIIDYVACPPSLEGVRDAYAVFIDGESMSPRYEPGETVWVHPHKPTRRGDDVIVQIRPVDDDGSPPWGYVKRMVGWQGNRLVLQQFNPPDEIVFDREEVVSIHPIVLSGKY